MIMPFELDGEKSKLFMKYFNAAMRDPTWGRLLGNATGQFFGNQYIVEQSVDFFYKEKPLSVSWKIIFENDILISIENTNQVGNSSYETTLLQFLNGVLQKALSQQKETFFVRQIYLTIAASNMPGEYWLPGFRLAPLFPTDNVNFYNTERAIVFDQEVKAIDLENAKEIGVYNASKYSAYMSFIFDKGFYLPTHINKYILQDGDGSSIMERKSTQFIDFAGLRKMPIKGELCTQMNFEGSLLNIIKFPNNDLTCPIEIRKILRGIAESPEDIKTAFDGCCSLYQLAHNAGRHYPTVKLSYMCGAVEAIVKSDTPKYKGFSDFMTSYSGENKRLYDFIYDVRSSHWHSGQFSMGDHEYKTWEISDSTMLNRTNTRMMAEFLMRNAIIKWLFEVLKISDTSENRY